MRDAGHRTPDAGHRTAEKAKIIYPPPRGVDIITDKLFSKHNPHHCKENQFGVKDFNFKISRKTFLFQIFFPKKTQM